MRQGNGTELPGMGQNDPRSASIGVIYVSPSDDRKSVLAAILTQEKLGRKQVAVVLPNQNKAFQRPQDFDDLKSIQRRRKLQSGIAFVIPPGPGLAEYAHQRRFPVYSTLESFANTLREEPNAKPTGKKVGLFGRAKAQAPTASAVGVGAAAGALAASDVDAQPQPSPTTSTAQSNQSAAGIQSPRRRSQFLAQQRAQAIDTHDDAVADAAPTSSRDSGASSAVAGAAAGVAGGLFAADLLKHDAADTHAGNQDDWDALPPVAGKASSDAAAAKVPPQTPPVAAGSHTANQAQGASSAGPDIIELPSTKKNTLKLADHAATQSADAAAVPPTPVTRGAPRRNSGQTSAVVAGGALAAGALAVGSSTASPIGTAASAKGARNSGATVPPKRGGPVGSSYRGGGGPRRNRPRFWWLIPLALILLVLIIVGGVVSYADPGIVPASLRGAIASTLAQSQTAATVTITPDNTTVQDSYQVLAVTGTPSTALHQVSLRQLSFTTPTQTRKVTGTGHTQTAGVKAAGTITFKNGSFTSSYSVGVTTFTTSSGIEVQTDKLAIVPVATSAGFGTQTASAHAVNAGTNGDIAASAIDQNGCCGSTSILAQNTSAFTGGQDPLNYSFIQQSDVTSVVNAEQDGLMTAAKNGLQAELHAGEVLANAPDCQQASPQADQTIGPNTGGTSVTSANVSTSATCTGEAYNLNAAQTLVTNLLKTKATTSAGEGDVLVGNIEIDTTVQSTTSKTVSLLMNAKGVWQYNFTSAQQEALRKQLAGQSAATARQKLAAYPGITPNGSFTLTLANGATSLPNQPDQIKITIKPVAGLKGSNTVPTPNTGSSSNAGSSQNGDTGAKGLVQSSSSKG